MRSHTQIAHPMHQNEQNPVSTMVLPHFLRCCNVCTSCKTRIEAPVSFTHGFMNFITSCKLIACALLVSVTATSYSTALSLFISLTPYCRLLCFLLSIQNGGMRYLSGPQVVVSDASTAHAEMSMRRNAVACSCIHILTPSAHHFA